MPDKNYLHGFDMETTKNMKVRTLQFYEPLVDATEVIDVWTNKCYLFKEDSCVEQTTKSEAIIKLALQSMLTKFHLVTHNGYFDAYHIFNQLGIMPNIQADSYILARLIPTMPTVRNGLDDCMKRYVDEHYDKYKYGKWEDFDWTQEELDPNALLYASRDAKATYQVEKAIQRKHPYYANAVYRLEVQLLPVITKMRVAGINVDKEKLNQSIEEYGNEVKRLREICDTSCLAESISPINYNSNPQLSELLFTKLKLPTMELTKKRVPSTKDTVLEALEDKSPIVKAIRDYKQANQIFKGYNSLKNTENQEDNGTLVTYHPEFKPLSDNDTGRLYTASPSINSWNWTIRESVIPSSSDKHFYFADIDQGELILLALLSNEELIIKPYEKGKDLFMEIAKIFFDTEKEDKALRRRIKTVMYAIIYGSEGDSVARELNIPIGEAKQLLDNILDYFRGIRIQREKVYEKLDKSGTVQTSLGRNRRLLEAYQEDKLKAKRKAFNFYVQSALADFVKRALVILDKSLPEGCRVVMSVYDSFLIEVPKDIDKPVIDTLLAKALTIKVNERVFTFRFKSAFGDNWLQAKDNSELV